MRASPCAFASFGEALGLPCVNIADPFPAGLGPGAHPLVVGATAVTQSMISARLPLTAWSWRCRRRTWTLPTAELSDEDPAGSRHLREVVTAYHRRVRSGFAVAEDAVVVSGFRQGLGFVLRGAGTARHPARRAGASGPREHDVIARRAGLDAVPVPVDDHGLDVSRLRETGARAVLLTPAHQCPTGVALGPSRRRDLVAWADEVDGVILEDDYDAEFRYDRQPVGSLQGLNPAASSLWDQSARRSRPRSGWAGCSRRRGSWPASSRRSG